MSFLEKNDTLKELQSKINAHNAAVLETKMALDAAQAKYDEAKAEMAAASDDDDVVAFATAKDAAKEAENSIEMVKMRLKRLMMKGAISKEEADEACRLYKRRLLEIDVEAARKITALIDEIVKIEAAANADSINTVKKYAELLRLLGWQEKIPGETGAPSRVHAILSKNIRLLRGLDSLNTGKKELYSLAGRKAI